MGVVVGAGGSANFAVLYDDSPRFAGLTLSVHPLYLELLDSSAPAAADTTNKRQRDGV